MSGEPPLRPLTPPQRGARADRPPGRCGDASEQPPNARPYTPDLNSFRLDRLNNFIVNAPHGSSLRHT